MPLLDSGHGHAVTPEPQAASPQGTCHGLGAGHARDAHDRNGTSLASRAGGVRTGAVAGVAVSADARADDAPGQRDDDVAEGCGGEPQTLPGPRCAHSRHRIAGAHGDARRTQGGASGK
jgi:hypothetical protein